MTPQSLANDIEKGRIDPLEITLLVIGQSARSLFPSLLLTDL